MKTGNGSIFSILKSLDGKTTFAGVSSCLTGRSPDRATKLALRTIRILNAHAEIKLGPMISKPRRPSVLTFSRGGTAGRSNAACGFAEQERSRERLRFGSVCVFETFEAHRSTGGSQWESLRN